MSATLLNNSADRFWVLPGAIEAKLSLPGLALAAARMSPTVLSGPSALVAISEVEEGGDRDRREIAQHVVGQLLEQRGADGGPVAGDVQEVAVRRGAGRRLGGDDAAGAGTVVDDELLAEPVGQPLGDDAHGGIGDAAGTIGNDDPHRTARVPGLGAGGTAGPCTGGEEGDQPCRIDQQGPAIGCPLRSPIARWTCFHPRNPPAVASLPSTRMLSEAAVQYQRRRRRGVRSADVPQGGGSAGPAGWPAESAPGCGAGGGGSGPRPVSDAAVGPGSSTGADGGRKCPIRSHLSHFRGPIHLMARSRLKGPRGDI